MREIKFRAWDGNHMINPYCELKENNRFWGEDLTNTHYDEPIDIMQFTGLRDKNGKEIYEGDIVQRGVIVFHNGKFQGQYFSEGVMYELWEDDLCQEKGIEVIGNIYEHPELLKTL